MQSAREELRAKKTVEASVLLRDLEGKANLELNSCVLFLSSWTVHSMLVQVNICLPNPENPRTLWSVRPPRDTFWTAAWLCRLMVMWKQGVSILVCFYFILVMGLALSDANKTVRHWMRAWCTVCPVLLENKIPKSWTLCFFGRCCFHLTATAACCAILHLNYFFYDRSAKSSEPGNTFVSSENHLSVFTMFASISVLCFQLPVLSPHGFCRFKSQLFCLSSLRETVVLVHQLYRIIGATSVQAGDTFESTKV